VPDTAAAFFAFGAFVVGFVPRVFASFALLAWNTRNGPSYDPTRGDTDWLIQGQRILLNFLKI
jgi:hypothetical protein